MNNLQEFKYKKISILLQGVYCFQFLFFIGFRTQAALSTYTYCWCTEKQKYNIQVQNGNSTLVFSFLKILFMNFLSKDDFDLPLLLHQKNLWSYLAGWNLMNSWIDQAAAVTTLRIPLILLILLASLVESVNLGWLGNRCIVSYFANLVLMANELLRVSKLRSSNFQET